MSITLVAARLGAILGNLIFGLLLDVTCAVPILLVAALLMGTDNFKLFLKQSQQLWIVIYLGGGILGILLPNTTKEPLI